MLGEVLLIPVLNQLLFLDTFPGTTSTANPVITTIEPDVAPLLHAFLVALQNFNGPFFLDALKRQGQLGFAPAVAIPNGCSASVNGLKELGRVDPWGVLPLGGGDIRKRNFNRHQGAVSMMKSSSFQSASIKLPVSVNGLWAAETLDHPVIRITN